MDDQREKWNQRYRNRESMGAVVTVLREHAYLLPAQGHALDLASGLGQNALFLAQRGLSCEAWDISDVALAELERQAQAVQLPIRTQCLDLSATSWPTACFDVVVVAHYLAREQCAAISALLKPGGLLFYQTFSAQKTPDANTPRRADFLLQPAELLSLFDSLTPLLLSDLGTVGELSSGLRNQAYLVAQNR